MIAALLLGASYGFAAGVSPGPMLGLVITQTLQRGWRAGNIVALAPLLTDLPIILLSVLLLGQLPVAVFGWLRVIGGLFVIYLGAETIRGALRANLEHSAVASLSSAVAAPAGGAREGSGAVLWRAVIANWLNPHPYLFWGTAGAQLLLGTYQSGGLEAAAALLLSFYALLVGAKLLLALLVHRGRDWLRGRGYQVVLAASGALLCLLGLLLLFEGGV